MGGYRVAGGCCGGFPDPEVDAKEKKEEKACCHGGCVQCNRETGCGFGPVKEGSVLDASGSDLSQKKETHAKAEYLIVTKDGEYLIDVNDPRQNTDVRILMKSEIHSQLSEFYSVMVFGLKRGEFCSHYYRYHDICPTAVIRIIPWDLEKWRAETSEGIV